MYQIESCYSNGDLARALEQAAKAVRDIGEDAVLHVVARLDPDVAGAWWVDVIYYRETHQRHNITGVSMPSAWTNP